MPVNIIDTLKPKNGGSFPIVEAIDVFVENYGNLAEAVSHFATDVMIEAINTVLSGKANTSDVNTAVANLQGQIDQIVISASAEAVVAPEVAQARVDANGETHSTLSERLDSDYSDINSSISAIAVLRESANLFNKNAVVVGKRAEAGSGKTYNSLVDDAAVNVSPIIEVEAEQSYTGNSKFFGNSQRILVYTSAGAYIAGLDGTDNGDGTYTYTTPPGTKYVRFNYNNSAIFDADSYMFVKGTTIPQTYEPYGSKYVSSGYVKDLSNKIDAVEVIANAGAALVPEIAAARTDIEGNEFLSLDARLNSDDDKHTTAETAIRSDLNEIATFTESKNLFDKSAIVENEYVVAGSGNTYNDLEADSTKNASPVIEVTAGKYTGNSQFFGNSQRIYIYTSDGYYAGGIDGTSNGDGTYTYTIPDGDYKYIRFNYNNSAVFDADTYMFVRGEVMPSPYEPYGARELSGGYVKVLSDKIDTETAELSEEIEEIRFSTPVAEVPDTIDHTKIYSGGYINGGVDGGVVTNPSLTNLWYSDFTEIISGQTYYYGGAIGPFYAAYYDENKNYISGYGNSVDNRFPNPFTAPQNAKYLRFTLSSTSASTPYNCWINIRNEAPAYTSTKYFTDAKYIKENNVSNPCDYTGDSFMIFNKGICIGDSITEGTFNYNEGGSTGYMVDKNYSYPKYMTKLSNVETVNKGIGGYTSVQWWNARQGDDFSGYDFAIINLGINDALQSVSSADTAEALENIISALRAANNGIKIFLATVVPAYSDGVSVFDDVNATISDVAESNECYLIDLSTYSHARKHTISEAGHLTAYGYLSLAKDYIAAISHIIDNNREDFKFVHFIGTDHSYS